MLTCAIHADVITSHSSGPLQAAELSKAAPELRDDGALTVGTAEVVSCALMQPRLDPAIAIGSPPRMRPRHRPERAMLLGVQVLRK